MTARKDSEPQRLEELGPPEQAPQVEEVPADKPQPDSGEVVYRVHAGGDVFESGIDGLDPITSTGTAIPADKADELKHAAHANDVLIRKVG